MKNTINTASPSQQKKMKPAPVAGFRFLQPCGGKKGAMKNIDYKPAQIYRGKKWYVYYSYREPESKKFKRFREYEDINRLKGSEREEHATALRNAINRQLSDGYNPFAEPLTIVVKNWTLNQGINYFKQNLENRGLRQRTIQSYQTVIRILYRELDLIKHTNIKEVTRHQIQAALLNGKRKYGWANTTYNNYLTFTKAIFSYLIDQDILEVNPAERIKTLPQSITRHRYFDEKTFKKIRENAEPDLLSFIMFLYHTGTRPNEARQLTHENILIDRKLLFIPASISKNKKDDYVPLTDYVLRTYGERTGYLFNRAINYYGRRFAVLKKALKLGKEYTLYSIKHSRALHLAQDGADPYTIMNLFRHSGLDITMSYLRNLGVNINREATTKGIRF